MKKDRRAWIVEAAAQAFALYGYKGTTMDTVAKIGNVGKGTIYTFFKTKDELFEEILSRSLGQMKLILDGEVMEDAPFLPNLLRVLDSLLEFRSDHELFVKLAQEIRDFGTPQALQATRRLETAVLRQIERELQKAIRKGECRECDTEIVAYLVYKQYLALASDWNKTHQPLGKEQIKQYIRLMLGEGIIV